MIQICGTVATIIAALMTIIEIENLIETYYCGDYTIGPHSMATRK